MNKVLKWFFLSITPIIVGCTSINVDEVSSYTNGFTNMTGTIRRAVVCGLTEVNPNYYNGWTGDCPGCDVDANVFSTLCRNSGLQVTKLDNARATKGNVTEAIRTAVKDMKAGDLLVLYVSSHGGQVPDTNGDEDDGMDETLCLWDGEMTDDYLAKLWNEIPPAVRVFYLTDSCNSGTNFKSSKPNKYRARTYGRSLPRAYSGALIHYGGCPDGKASYGGDAGGEWTSALRRTWDGKRTYVEWFNEAKKLMTSQQVSTYAEYGIVTSEFRNKTALQ